CAVCSQSSLPLFRSKARTFHWCEVVSFTGSVSPYKPTRNDCLESAETAVVTNTRSPQTTGDEFASPGTSTFHTTLVPFSTSKFTGVLAPLPTPEAPGPRNWGQSPSPAHATA